MEVQSDFFTSGKLEILRFVPPYLLKKDFEELELEEFVELLAQARYVQELEAAIISKGIADVFPE